MQKRLIDLMENLPIQEVSGENLENIQITGISFDSRKIKPGFLFIPLVGVGQNGHRYIPDALQNGASAVLGSQHMNTGRIPFIRVKDTRLALAQVSAAFYEFPARRLTVIGVTGTDGKTTTCNLIFAIMKHAGLKTGLISTVNAIIGTEVLDTGFHVTTPDAPDVQKYLSMMVEAGLSHVVLEVTSHGLAQDRVTGCEFDIGVVTNITHEHLDFHKDYDHYRAAKGRLFEFVSESSKKKHGSRKLAVLNQDDSSYPFLRELTTAAKITYGLNPSADYSAKNITNTKTGTRFELKSRTGNLLQVDSNLVGDYNVLNCLAAMSVCVEGLGIEPATVVEGIRLMPGVPGRYEMIHLGQDFEAVVDFAHTPNALERMLTEARKRTSGKIITVFGSAGLRDREKRKLMTRVSVSISDISILTAEDPRTEPLEAILGEMSEAGISAGAKLNKDLFVIPDRGNAIRKAVSLASKGDLVVACGKGHEQSMCFGDTEYPWDDRLAMRAALAEFMHSPGEEMPRLPTSDK